MSTSRLLLATAAAAASFAVASTSFAQDAATEPVSPEQPPPIAQPQPQMQMQPQPMLQQQQPTVGTTPAATTPTTPGTQGAVAQPQPVSTTTTTQGAYAVNNDRIDVETRHNRPNKALLVTGSSLFLLSYGGSIAVAAQSDRDADKRLYIPVVGPWLDLGQRNCDANPCGDSEGVAKAFIIASGAAQGLGVLTALSSFIIPERERVQVRSAATKPEVKVLPVSFAGGGGLGAVGRF